MRLIALITLIILPVMAVSQTVYEDGPWITVPKDASYETGPMSMDDIIAIANLDDDPSVISTDERDMIALLVQMLGTAPVQN